MTRFQALKSVSIAAIACAVAAPAYAQTEIDELVVTARKREENLRDIPAAVTAFSADQIRDLGGIANTQSLLANVPAVNFANTSNPVTSEVSIRGSGTSRATSAEAAVGLFRNGVFVKETSAQLAILKSGFEQMLFRLSTNHGTFYGFVAVGLAMLTGWLGRLIFRRD